MSLPVNWEDEIPGSVEGTPVNRKRLMWMQGFCTGTTTIEKRSDGSVAILERSEEGDTDIVIRKLPNGDVVVVEQFGANDGMTISHNTAIIKTDTGITISENTTS